MTSKLKYLTKMSLNRKIKTKWFVVANVILLLFIVGLINIDSIIGFFGGDFDDKIEILVIDDTGTLYDDLESVYGEYYSYMANVSNADLVRYDKSYDEAIEEIADTDNMILVISCDEENYLKASLVTDTYMDNMVVQVLSYSLNTVRNNLAIEHYNLSSDILSDIDGAVDIDKVYLDEDNVDNSSQMDLIMNVIFPIFILPFFMLTMFLVQMIGAEINEEKTTKSMEIIISNVSSETHFFSKLIAGNVFVLLQGLLLIIYMVLGVGLRFILSGGMGLDANTTSTINDLLVSLNSTGFISNLKYIIPVALIIMILTFVAYSLVAAILASMTTNIEDFQQVQTPIIIVSVIGYYLAVLASMFNGSLFIRILSYVPFISALLTPSLLALGQIGVVDVFISFVMLILVIYLMFKYGLRIYKEGILNYSSTSPWKKIFKTLKRERS